MPLIPHGAPLVLNTLEVHVKRDWLDRMQSIDSFRDDVRRSSGGGFAFLFANGLGWLAAGLIGLFVGPKVGAWSLLFMGAVTMPLAFGLERALGYPKLAKGNPLLPLIIQLALTQVVALPAVIVAFALSPAHLPIAFAAVVGGHFLPYTWLQRSKTYLVLAVAVGVLPWLCGLFLGRAVLPYLPLLVATLILAGAFKLRAEVQSI